MKAPSLWLVALVDLVCVLVFAAIGRASHGEAVGPDGPADDDVAVRGGLARRLGARPGGAVRSGPSARSRGGALVWVPTVVVGMLLRVATGAGVQTSFVIVATVVLGVFLLGWRGVAALVRRSRGAPGRTSRCDITHRFATLT